MQIKGGWQDCKWKEAATMDHPASLLEDKKNGWMEGWLSGSERLPGSQDLLDLTAPGSYLT